jgi:sec-independent protein translocase protein TatA
MPQPMPNIGPGELILILVIALVIIGPGRLPDVGAALGKSIREFRKASTDMAEATRIDTSPLPPSSAAAPQPNVLSNPAPVSPSAAPAPTPEPPAVAPTAPTVPAPVLIPPDPAQDETAGRTP